MAQDESQVVLAEALQRIKNLMNQEKWLDAHRACLEILRFDPENLKIIRLKNKIERQVKKINIKAIKDDLRNIQPLFKEKKYDELLRHLKELEPYRNDYKPLDAFIRKVQKAYISEVGEQQKEHFADEMKNIDTLIEQKKYQDATRLAQRLRIAKVNESEVKKKLERIKKEWVNHELQQNEKILNSEKYEEALMKAQQIKKIDPTSPKLNRLIDGVKKKYQQHKVMEKRDFIYKGLEKTRTLLQLKKYHKAVQAAQEVLDVDPENKKAQYMFAKAKRKAAKSTDKELRKQMKTAHKKMKEVYKKDKTKFTRI